VVICSQCNADIAADAAFCGLCGAAASRRSDEPTDAYVGHYVARKYFVNFRIGGGGMGEVYKATDTTLDRPVALKMLNRMLSADRSIVQRFHNEARAACRLNHPNSINVIELGQTDDGTLFIAMEYLRGRNLARVIVDDFPIPPARIVNLVSQILAALTEAHTLGVLHRDLKPENVMVEPRTDEPDFVKVLDFGLAQLNDGRGPPGPRLTKQGTTCGTPGYMSPEQARGEELDARSDLYAVGVLLYEMLTGKLPFDATTPQGLVAKVMVERPIPPKERRPGLRIPPDLEALMMSAISPDRQHRPASAQEFRRALLSCSLADSRLPDSTASSAARGTAFFPVKQEDEEDETTPEPAPLDEPPAAKWMPSRRVLLLGTVAGTAILLAVLAYLFLPGAPTLPLITTFSAATPVKAGTTPTISVDFGPAEATGVISLSADANARPCGDRPIAAGPSTRKCAPVASDTTYVLTVATATNKTSGAFVVRVSPSIMAFSAPMPVTAGQAPVLTVEFAPAGATAVISLLGDAAARPCGEGPIAAVSSTAACAPINAETTYVLNVTRDGSTASETFRVKVAPPSKSGGTRPTIHVLSRVLNSLPTPLASTGDGILVIEASPWALVSIEGRPFVETPVEARVSAGTYSVRATYNQKTIRESMVVAAGERKRSFLTFTK
jgi:serine/threonine protein kinase